MDSKSTKRRRLTEDKDLIPSSRTGTVKLDDYRSPAASSDPMSREPYQQIFPQTPEAIDFLFSSRLSDALREECVRLGNVYRIRPEQAIEELRRLLAIKVFVADTFATKISPTPLMDSLWHEIILETELYTDLQKAIGCVLHHRPSGAKQVEATQRQWRLNMMKATYTAIFSAAPIDYPPRTQSIPNHSSSGSIGSSRQPQASEERPGIDNTQDSKIAISVIDSRGDCINLKVRRGTPAKRLIRAVADVWGFDPDPMAPPSFRLMFDGQDIANEPPESTLADLDIKDGDELHFIIVQIGC